MSDPMGAIPFWVVAALVGMAIGGICGGASASEQEENIWIGMGEGALTGGLVGTGVGILLSVALAGSTVASTGSVISGGKTLLTTVSYGGIGAGTSHISANTGMALTPYVNTTCNIREAFVKGRKGEAAVNIVKNTAHIPSLTGTAAYRIPDGLDYAGRILSEVKNYSGTLSYTSQIRDFVLWSQYNGFKIHLYTNAQLPGPLQKIVNSGWIEVFPINY